MRVFVYLDIAKRHLLGYESDLDNIKGCNAILSCCVNLLKENKIDAVHVLDCYMQNITIQDIDEKNWEKIKDAVVPEINKSDAVCYIDFDGIGELGELNGEFRKIVISCFKPIKPISVLLEGKPSASKLKMLSYIKSRVETVSNSLVDKNTVNMKKPNLKKQNAKALEKPKAVKKECGLCR